MTTPTETVDQFVKRKVLPEYREIVAALRELMRETAPKAEEHIAYGIPMYKGHKNFVYINPSKSYITFGFAHGIEIKDKHGLLKYGVGKHGRNVRLKTLKDINKEALRDYIKQALKIDESR